MNITTMNITTIYSKKKREFSDTYWLSYKLFDNQPRMKTCLGLLFYLDIISMINYINCRCDSFENCYAEWSLYLLHKGELLGSIVSSRATICQHAPL